MTTSNTITTGVDGVDGKCYRKPRNCLRRPKGGVGSVTFDISVLYCRDPVFKECVRLPHAFSQVELGSKQGRFIHGQVPKTEDR